MNQDLKQQLKKENLALNESQIETIINLINDFHKENIQKIEQLESELYHLKIDKNKYQFLLTQKFQDKSNQTIAYQFGRLLLDFFKNPIKNFITPKALLNIYCQFLKRKEKKTELTALEKKCIQVFYKPGNETIDSTFEELCNLSPKQHIVVTEIPKISKKSKKPLKLNLNHRKVKDIKVAIILDEFSYNSFKDEFTPLILTPSNWKFIFSQHKPDIFFCESAWSGTDSINRPWKGKIYASKNFKKENRTELFEILEYCNNNGIPTVFWNKEDPTHYPDRVHDFVKTAQLFDFVFTTAEECVEQYKKDYNLENVYALPFATNPIVFNPIEEYNSNRTNDIIFAGSWYANHIERSQSMCTLFDNLLNSGYNLKFFNRYYGDTDPNHIIPDKYKKYEKPSIPNKDIGNAYKSSIFGLNFNTVVDSETMFARRVFELMSSNTLVLSNYSKGMDKMFGNNVLFLDQSPDILKQLTDQDIDKIRENNLKDVLSNHTYKKRFETILEKIGITYNKEIEKVTLVIQASNKQQVNQEVNLYKKLFSNEKYKLLVVLSEKISDLDSAELYSELNYLDINIVALSYIKKYKGESSNFINTPYFALADSIESLDYNIIEKALLHSNYIVEDYISLSAHKDKKYIFEEKMTMNNIFAPKDKFIYSIINRNKVTSDPIYYIYC